MADDEEHAPIPSREQRLEAMNKSIPQDAPSDDPLLHPSTEEEEPSK